MHNKIFNNTKSKIYHFLRRTEKITGIDNVYFFKGGFWVSVAQVAFVLAGIALSVAFAQLGTKALFGKYQFLLAVVATLLVAVIPGANTALMQSVSRGLEKTFPSIFKQKFRWSLLGSLGLLLVAGYFYFIRGDWPFGLAFLIAAISFPFLFWTAVINSFFAGKGDFLHANAYLVIERIVMTIAVVVALFIKPDFLIVIIVYYLARIVVNIFSMVEFKKDFSLKGGEDKDALSYGLNLTWINLIPKGLMQIDRIVIPAILGVEALAVYVIAIIIPETIENFINMMQTVAFKKLVHLPKKEILPKLRRWWLILFFIFIVGATIIGIPFAINLLYGDQYSQSIFLAQLFALIIPLNFVWRMFSTWMLSQKKTKGYFYLNNGFYLTNTVALIAVLLFTRTLEGAIASRLAVAFLFFVISLIYLKKK